MDGYVSAYNRGIPQVVNTESWNLRVQQRRGGGGWRREARSILGGNSKSFMGKGREEIAGWTLRVLNYFYCPYSPSFLTQSGVLGSSKKRPSRHPSPKEMSRQVRTNNRSLRKRGLNSRQVSQQILAQLIKWEFLLSAIKQILETVHQHLQSAVPGLFGRGEGLIPADGEISTE